MRGTERYCRIFWIGLDVVITACFAPGSRWVRPNRAAATPLRGEFHPPPPASEAENLFWQSIMNSTSGPEVLLSRRSDLPRLGSNVSPTRACDSASRLFA